MNAYKQTSAIGLALVLTISLMVGLVPAIAQDGIEPLTETAESPNGMLTMNYPAGWVLDLSLPSAIRLGTSQAMLDADGTDVPLPAGEFQVIALEGATMLNMMAPGWEDAASLDEAIDLVLMHVLAEGTSVTSHETTTLAGYPALIIITLQPDREGLVGVIDFEGNYVLVGVNSQIGEYAEHADLGLAILDTLHYAGLDSPSEHGLPLAETYVLESGYSLSYPAGWVTYDELNGNGTAKINLGSNDRIAEFGDFPYDFEPGDVWFLFTWTDFDQFYFEIEEDWGPVDVLNARFTGVSAYLEDTYEISIDGKPLAIGEGLHATGKAILAIAFFWDDDTVCSILVLTNGDEYEQFKPTLLAIAESTLPAAETGSITPDLGALVDTLNEPPTESVTVPTSINGPADCYNVAVSITDYSSEFGGTDYAPANLLDNNPATGWSSAGGVEVEYVVISLDGQQTIYGILFNSYSPSPRYETDSIKDFSVEATLSDGSTRAILKGQAALAQGYQSYLFDPVETDQVRFIFSSTHGGGYYEAADIMVCALEGATQLSVPGVPPSPITVEYRQWASRAQATSQYSATDWSAQQATGAPNTVGCGDMGTAWASGAADGVDTLTVFFDTPVIPTQVNIHQTYNPGAITGVELIPAESGPVIPIPNSADQNTGCPGIFALDVPADLTDGQLVSGVAIRLDQRNHTGWNEIDAVELVGEAQLSAITVNGTGTDLPPLPAAVACNVQARSRVNMRGGPGTNYNVAGQLRYGTVMPANGQTTGQDGYTWWRLTYGGWVRGDVVDAATNCSSRLPFVSADDPLPLTQRYMTPEGFAFDYPQDWVLIEEPGGATIGNSWEAAQNPFGERYYAGEFQASIRWLTIDELAPDTGLATGATPMQVLRAAISVSSGLDMAEPYELQIGDQVVAAAYGTFYDDSVEIAIVIFEAKNGLYGSVLTGSDLRGLEQFEPTLRAIIASALAGSR